jgi:hypothetical protein
MISLLAYIVPSTLSMCLAHILRPILWPAYLTIDNDETRGQALAEVVPGQGHFVVGFRLLLPGSATLQRGFRSRAGARRSQGNQHYFLSRQDN